MMKKMTRKRTGAEGFTIAELLVTVVVTSIVLIMFFWAYVTATYQRVNVARQAAASDIAYSNLKKFTTKPIVICDDSMDLTAAGSATKTGKLLGDDTNATTTSTYGFIAESPTELKNRLGAGASQKVVAFAPDGCTNFNGKPMKIESTVTYGTDGEKVIHASYVF